MLTEANTLSNVGLEKRSLKGGGDRPPETTEILEMPQGSSICDYSCRLPENMDTFYLKGVGIP